MIINYNLIKMIKKTLHIILLNINRIFNYIITEKNFKNNSDYYKCITELFILVKNTFNKIEDIYMKYILLPKLNSIVI